MKAHMSTHNKTSPGPWRFGRYWNDRGGQDGPIRIWDAGGHIVADVPADAPLRRVSDARLIASAPALLDALKSAESWIDSAGRDTQIPASFMREIRRVIEEAGG